MDGSGLDHPRRKLLEGVQDSVTHLALSLLRTCMSAFKRRQLGLAPCSGSSRRCELVTGIIESVGNCTPCGLPEVITVRQTLRRRTTGALAYFDLPGSRTEAFSGCLEHSCASASISQRHPFIARSRGNRWIQNETSPSNTGSLTSIIIKPQRRTFDTRYHAWTEDLRTRGSDHETRRLGAGPANSAGEN